jgi:hypothetical protein
MSYEHLWGVPFHELRSAGFRPLTDQAWAGVKSTDDEFHRAGFRAWNMGLKVHVPFTRAELNTRNRYTLDLAHLRGMRFSFRWSLLPTHDPNVDISRLPPSDISAWGFFTNETDLVAWKLAVL